MAIQFIEVIVYYQSLVTGYSFSGLVYRMAPDLSLLER